MKRLPRPPLSGVLAMTILKRREKQNNMPAVKKVTKKVVKKAVAKPVAKKVAVKKDSGQARMTKVEGSLSVQLFDNTGKQKGTVKLPEAVFCGKIVPALMAQAVRVYLANQR